jgi:hypothetical protein
MPFVFTVDGFNIPNDLPPKLLEPLDMVAIDRHLGSWVIDRLGPSPLARRPREVVSEVEVLPNGDQLHRHRTPVGTLQARYSPSREANTAFLVAHGVSQAADYEALMALVTDPEITVSAAGVGAVRARLDQIGDDGILYNAGPSTPIMDLTRVWVGLQRFVEDLADRRDLVERVLDVMARKSFEEYEALAASTPAQVIVFWDDVTSTYLSPALFERYVAPVYRTYADICHAHGKLLVAHACGHLRAFVPYLPDTGIDAIDWLTPPPTGDVVFAAAQQAFGDRICIMGALAPAIMRFGTPDDVERHLRGVLAGVDTHRGVVLMAPPPIGTPMANLDRIRRLLGG